mgnify:CR=1 FL=1|jgi:hypothetical protein
MSGCGVGHLSANAGVIEEESMQGTDYENCNEPLRKNKVKFPSVEDARKAATNAEGKLLFPTLKPTGQLLEYHSVQNSGRDEEEMKAAGSVHIQDIALAD